MPNLLHSREHVWCRHFTRLAGRMLAMTIIGCASLVHAASPQTAPAPEVPANYDQTVPPPSPGVHDLGNVTRLDVRFPSDGFLLAGHLYVTPGKPPDGGRWPAVVLDGPAPSIKELTVPMYAIRLARAGYLTLTFDRRGFGGSEGCVRQHMDPHDNIRDIRNATTYLVSRHDVDAERLAGVGVYMGAGFMLQAAGMDRRFRAVATIAGHYSPLRFMRDLLGHEGWIALLKTQAAERLEDWRAGAPRTHVAIAPASAPVRTALIRFDEGYQFYVGRQQHSWQCLLLARCAPL